MTHSWTRFVFLASIVVSCTVPVQERGVAESPPVFDPDEICLFDATHFAGSGGETVVAPAGIYRVEAQGADQLRLVPVSGGSALTVAAMTTRLAEAVAAAEATVVPAVEPTEVHVVLLSPDGSGREAVGFTSGVRTRGGDAPLLGTGKVSQQQQQRARARLRVDTPRANENWAPGSRHEISWRMQGVTARGVRIALFQGRTMLANLVRTAPNTGRYDWLLPHRLPTGADAAGSFSLLVAATDNTAYGYSGPFTMRLATTATQKSRPAPAGATVAAAGSQVWADVPTKVEIGALLDSESTYVISGPGFDIERVSGFRADGKPNDQPGFSREHPLVLEAVGNDATALRGYFDAYLTDPAAAGTQTGSVLVRNLAGNELFRWNFHEFAPAGKYVQGASGRTRFTFVSTQGPDNQPSWALGSLQDPFGIEGSFNPASDTRVEIHGPIAGDFFPTVEVDEANRTLTLTYDRAEGNGVINWVLTKLRGEEGKYAGSVIQEANGQEVSRRNYFGLFPVRYEQFTGYELDVKVKARVVISYDWWEDAN